MITKVETKMITKTQLADALDNFWNVAIGAARNSQDSTACATVGAIAEGLAAVANTLREQEAVEVAQRQAWALIENEIRLQYWRDKANRKYNPQFKY